MASGTNTKKPDRNSGPKLQDRRDRRPVLFSRLSRVIFLSHLIGLVILITGSLVFNQYTQELVKARINNLESQAAIISSILGDAASGNELNPKLDVDAAASILRRLELPPDWRVRLFDPSGILVADSLQFDETISVSTLDSIAQPVDTEPVWRKVGNAWSEKVETFLHNLPWRQSYRDNFRWNLRGDIREALDGNTVGGKRYDSDDNLIVTVTMPVRRVQQNLGAVTVDSKDVEDIIAAERRALLPFISLAILAAFFSSLALTMSIVYPLRHLAQAAEDVARSNKKLDNLPDYSSRGDEIGELSSVLSNMTDRLYSRIDDIANFAADVAHEIKNPLTSLRSASDTLRHVKTDEQRQKLLDIIQDDVSRMDRLISDISKASKVDANLARENAQVLNVVDILSHIAEFYEQTGTDQKRTVRLLKPEPKGENSPILIKAFDTPFAQVIRNLVDNALTFSPPGGEVRIFVDADHSGSRPLAVIRVEDDGPGIPPENLETVFERFYTERPKGAQFGSHSGLGLAICRQIITAHKGTIHAENREIGGEVIGARFVVKIPIHRAPKRPRLQNAA